MITLYRSLLLLLSFLPIAHGLTNWCDNTKKICVYGALDSTGQNINFTIYSSFSGWAAIGLGGESNGMIDADMYIGWKNSSNGGVVTYRKGSQGAPTAQSNANGFAPISPFAIAQAAKAIKHQFVFSFKRPLKQGKEVKSGSGTNFIWAAADKSPQDPNSAESAFTIHDQTGRFNVDFTAANENSQTSGSPILSPPILKTNDKDKIKKIHGFVMIFAWAISPFIGIFIARYLKGPLGVWWFRLHIFFMFGVTGLLTLASGIFTFLYANGPHFADVHQAMGLFISIILIFQIILGYLSDALWSKDRTLIPWWDKLHWWVGRVVCIVSLINCHFGIKLLNPPNIIVWYAGYWGTVLVGIISLVVGQIKFGQVHHVNGVMVSKKKKKEAEAGQFNPYSISYQ